MITKDELDILNLDADVQKKRMETLKYNADVQIKKVEELRCLLEAHYIDDDRTVLGSEPYWTPAMTGKNRDIVISKIINIIESW